MKRTLTIALSLVLGAAIVAPVFAQDQFPDVPANHWAFKELSELKAAGLLVGYPDGLFRGGRPASRYELAVAIHAVWTNLKNQQDALRAQMEDLMKRLDGFATKADLDALKAQVDALAAELNRLKSEDVARLNRLVDEFRGELGKLGANVDDMKKSLADLSGRVDKIEARLPKFNMSGSIDGVAFAGYSTSNRSGITVDGRPTGVGRGSLLGGPVGIGKDNTFLHEGSFTVKNLDDATVKFQATGVFGNMLNSNRNTLNTAVNPGFAAFGDQSRVQNGLAFSEGDPSMYFQRFMASFDTSIGGLAFNATVGRQGYKISPLTFQRPDTTPYFSNERWDDGEWTFDGANLGFNFSKVKLNVFLGRVSSFTDSQNNAVQPMFAGQNGAFDISGDNRPIGFATGNLFQIDNIMGANLGFAIGSMGHVGVSYTMLDSNNERTIGNRQANRVTVYGANLKLMAGGFDINGEYAKSNVQYNTSNVISRDNAAWNINLARNFGKFSVNAGYRRTEAQFAAPGDWGRIGIWWNPTDIEGFNAGVGFALNDKLNLNVGGEFYKGIGASGSTLGTSDKVNRFTAGLDYKVASNYSVMLGFEQVNWDLSSQSFIHSGGKPTERWINLGFGWTLASNAKLSLLWQMSDYNGKGFWFPFNGGFGRTDENAKATGGLLTTQLSIRF